MECFYLHGDGVEKHNVRIVVITVLVSLCKVVG